MVRALLLIAGRDLALAVRYRGDVATVVLFFVLTAAIFPFGVGPEPELLRRIAAGVIWVTAVLAVMLSLERLFLADYEDGGLDLLAALPLPLELTVLAKAVAHWLTTGVPVMVAAPVVALLYGMDPGSLPVLLAALALGTPSLSLLGAVGAALTLGARRGGILVPLLVLPLYVPALIFGVAATDAALAGMAAKPHLLLLSALLLLMVVLGPLAAAAALRQALE